MYAYFEVTVLFICLINCFLMVFLFVCWFVFFRVFFLLMTCQSQNLELSVFKKKIRLQSPDFWFCAPTGITLVRFLIKKPTMHYSTVKDYVCHDNAGIIHTLTARVLSWPRFVKLTNTLLATLQTESGPACKGTTGVVFKELRRANASGRVCIWHDKNRARDDCRISNKHTEN